jgi:hypothetical protein
MSGTGASGAFESGRTREPVLDCAARLHPHPPHSQARPELSGLTWVFCPGRPLPENAEPDRLRELVESGLTYAEAVAVEAHENGDSADGPS